MKSLFKLLLSLFIIGSFGCASSYRAINPPAINYSAYDINDGISFAYKYDVLQEKGNKKYANKEEKNHVKLVSIKITNNLDSTILIGRDLQFYSGNNPIIPMDPLTIRNELKQPVAAYLLYLLLTPLKLFVTKGDGIEATTETYNIGFVLGPTISLGNIIASSSANESFQKELNQYNILNVELKKGQTVYGIIGIRETSYTPLYLKLRK